MHKYNYYIFVTPIETPRMFYIIVKWPHVMLNKRKFIFIQENTIAIRFMIDHLICDYLFSLNNYLALFVLSLIP